MSVSFRSTGPCVCSKCGGVEAEDWSSYDMKFYQIDGETVFCGDCFNEWRKEYEGPFWIKHIPGFADFMKVPVVTFENLSELYDKLSSSCTRGFCYSTSDREDFWYLMEFCKDGSKLVSGYVWNFDYKDSGLLSYEELKKAYSKLNF